MANSLSPLIPKLVARGLMALRQEARMARMVYTGYEQTPGDKFSTVTVPVPASVSVADVTPSNTPPATNDTTPTSVSIAVDQWKEAAFYLSDKDMQEIDAQSNFLPMQASEAIKAIANTIDAALLALYKDVYGYAGTAGTTPFATDVSAYLSARKNLNNQLAPMDPRYVVLNPDAEANALGLRAFQDAEFSGSIDGIVNGQINNKLGARWSMNQNTPNHTAGAASGYLVNNSGGYAAAATTMTIDTGSGAFNVGDIFAVAGDTQTQTVQSSVGGATATSVTFAPGLSAAVVDNAAITSKASHAVNLVFHPMAFALVTRPFAGSDPEGLGRFFSAVDPVSGIALRLEVTREYKRTRWAYDVLYGVKTVRAALASRMAG